MKYFSPNRPHPESRAEVPPTGNFSPSKNDRYYFLLPPSPPLSNLPSTFCVLHLDGGGGAACTCIYRSLHSSHSVDSFNAVVRKRTLAETQQRSAAATLEGGRLEWAHYVQGVTSVSSFQIDIQVSWNW